LEQDNHHLHEIHDTGVYSHVRLNIYPDGGVARLRIYGEPQCDWEKCSENEIFDLAALEYGGRAVACSNQAFGSSMLNLSMPGRGINMRDGWETVRRRIPGNEWVILALGHPGEIKAIELDTAHYKGNYPDRASVQGGLTRGDTVDSLVTQSMFWKELLPEQKLEMDAVHRFENELQEIGPITHVRVNVIPDGGLSRVRIHGHIVR
jgi:allantoicase